MQPQTPKPTLTPKQTEILKREKKSKDGYRKKLIGQSRDTVQKEDGTGSQSVENKEYSIDQEPNYVKFYIDTIHRIYDLPKGNLLHELLRLMTYEGEITLNPYQKAKICEITGNSTGTLDNFLSKLKAKKIIWPIPNPINPKRPSGTFKVNPEIFGRGKWKDLVKQRDAWLKIEWNEEGEQKVSSSFGQKAKELEAAEAAAEASLAEQIIKIDEYEIEEEEIKIEQPQLKAIGE